jgi:hypothetical protein
MIFLSPNVGLYFTLLGRRNFEISKYQIPCSIYVLIGMAADVG